MLFAVNIYILCLEHKVKHQDHMFFNNSKQPSLIIKIKIFVI